MTLDAEAPPAKVGAILSFSFICSCSPFKLWKTKDRARSSVASSYIITQISTKLPLLAWQLWLTASCYIWYHQIASATFLCLPWIPGASHSNKYHELDYSEHLPISPSLRFAFLFENEMTMFVGVHQARIDTENGQNTLLTCLQLQIVIWEWLHPHCIYRYKRGEEWSRCALLYGWCV